MTHAHTEKHVYVFVCTHIQNICAGEQDFSLYTPLLKYTVALKPQILLNLCS